MNRGFQVTVKMVRPGIMPVAPMPPAAKLAIAVRDSRPAHFPAPVVPPMPRFAMTLEIWPGYGEAGYGDAGYAGYPDNA